MRSSGSAANSLFDLIDEVVASYAPGQLVPLWEERDFVTVCQLVGENVRFLSIHLEGGFKDLGSSVQCALAALFIKLYEDEEKEEDLREAARKLGFLHLDRLLADLGRGFGHDYKAWEKGFLASCESDPRPVAAGHGGARRLEFTEGSSDKFWEIIVEGSGHTVRYGRIGTRGQEKTKTFVDGSAARHDAEKLIASKTKKGLSRSVGTTTAVPTVRCSTGLYVARSN